MKKLLITIGFSLAVTTFSMPAQANTHLDRLLADYDRDHWEHRISALEYKTTTLETEVDGHAKIISKLVWPELPKETK